MKRSITLAFIVILSLVLLTGCGGDNATEDTGTDTGTVNEAVVNTEDTDGEAPAQTDDAAVVSPPAWLVGEWTPKDPVFEGQDILVTDSNVVIGSGALDIEKQANSGSLSVEDSLDGEVYTLSYEVGGVVTTYIFKDLGNNEMLLQFGMGGNLMDMNFVKK